MLKSESSLVEITDHSNDRSSKLKDEQVFTIL